MSRTIDKTVATGVSVVIVAVLAIVGVGMLDSAQLTNVLSVDSQSEWQNNGTFSGTNASADGFLQLEAANTSGSYDSNSFSNSSDASRYVVVADIPDSDNSSAELVVDGTTYTLSDGTNRFSVSGGEFTVNLERDSTSVESPRVDSVSVLAGDTGGVFRLVAVAAFALLLLLVVVNDLGAGLGRVAGRRD